jgi:predicted metal-binding protein
MKQETAVEWLAQQLLYYVETDYAKEIIKKALEMEKEQIVNSHIFAHLHYGGGMITPSEKEFEEFAQQYYNETFKK